MNHTHDVLITGGTGYIGKRLVPALLMRGHRVRALARAGSLARVPAGATPVIGDALDADSVAAAVHPGDTIVHLVGTPHPSPAKAQEFARVDLPSILATTAGAKRSGAAHVVYISVAHPAPTMHAYIAVRVQGERALAEAGVTATVLRPWYVLGPGHWWPIVLMPVYATASLIPSLRPGAQRLGLVTLDQMVRGIARAVDDPPAEGTQRVVDVPGIRAS